MRMETVLIDDPAEVRRTIGVALTGYDGSGDWWTAISNTIDINVYVEDGAMHVVAYPVYDGIIDTDHFQVLVRVNAEEG